MILLVTVLSVAGLIGIYFLIIKPVSDAKISKKTKSQAEVVTPVGSDDVADADSEDVAGSYEHIIDDYPTYHRNKN